MGLGVRKERNPGSAQTRAIDGTYAYAVQDGTNANSEAAVKNWKEALSNFSSLPPEYSEDTEPYNNPQNISFISLVNRKDNPKVDCVYFTCPAKPADPDQDSDTGGLEHGPEGRNKKQRSGNENTVDKEVKALRCVITPNALIASTAPYTQSQWDQVTTGLSENAAAGVPTPLGFAAAAVGFFLL
ncbi:SAG family member [Eimeria brunetti]|uniref:SAG family member n=1 Tax=Eimeria brunetti TaxID=51314 RepID=U6LUC3_9EIME|nr:SAG family member [Eimeria brunetti]